MARPIVLAGMLLASVPVSAIAQNAAVAAAVERLAPVIIEIRHRIHQHPELGNRETETARLVADHLRALRFDEVRTGIAVTGVVGVLRGGRPGPVVGIRADMDALPVTEDTPFPFKSTVRTTYLGQEVGVAHACGHDIHTSVQLGVASVLASLRDRIPGTVVLVFQPAEEGPPPGERGGADLMVEEGALADPRPEAIFALHAMPDLGVGAVGYTPGPAFAASDHFTVVLRGRQAHGASPHLSIDPIVMAAQTIMAFQTIRSRSLPPLEPSVVTVGIVRGGTRFNIIPSEVHLEGTVRTYDAEIQDAVERRMREILAGITAAYGGSYEMEYERGVPVTINDVDLATRMAPSLARVVGPDNVSVLDPATGAEDFAYFANEVPGFYFRLGTLAPGGTSGGLHTPDFQAADGAVPVGIAVMANAVLDFLEGRGVGNGR